MKKFEITDQKAEAEQAIISTPSYHDERPHLVELVRALRFARAEQDYRDLFLRLFKRVKARQDLSSQLRKQQKKIREEIAQLGKEDPTPKNALQAKSAELAERKHQLKVNEALRWVLFGVGDGLAWRALNYDRGALTLLGMGQRVSRLAEGKGLEAE